MLRLLNLYKMIVITVKKYVLLAALILNCSSFGNESQITQAIRESDKIIERAYTKAIKILILLEHKSVDGSIENKLGTIYHFTDAIQNYDTAREWYMKAVAKGNGEAANHLGRLYNNGEGVARDLKAAREWYKKGMELGNKEAKENYLTFPN